MAISSIVSTETTPATDSIIIINGKKAVATKNLILGFGTNETAFSKMWTRNENDFLEGNDWNWFNSYTGQIVNCRNNNPKVGRIFWTTGVSKASTKFNSVKAKEFAQKMFDNYGSQLDGETKLVKSEAQSNFALPKFDSDFFKQIAQTIEKLELDKSKLKLEVETKDNTISNLIPKADFVDNVLVKGNTGLTAMSIVAKEMGLGSVRLYKILRDEKIWFWALNEHGVNENNVKQEYIDNGSFVVKAFYSERDKRTYDKIFATNKGKLLCYKLVKENTPSFEIKLIENNQK